MKLFIRLMIFLFAMALSCASFSGDNNFDASLPLTASQLMQRFQTFIAGSLLVKLEELKVWSFNRDHYSSDDSGPGEQTVDGVLTVTASFNVDLSTIDSDQPGQSLKPIINAYFLSVLPLLTDYFRSHFNTEKDYYLGRANIKRAQGSATVADPDDSDHYRNNNDVSHETCSASEEAGAVAIIRECKYFDCMDAHCESAIEAPEYWNAHLTIDRERGMITYEASFYYAGFLEPVQTAGSSTDPDPEQNDEDEAAAMITQTRRCIDLYREGLDKGLSRHLTPESE